MNRKIPLLLFFFFLTRVPVWSQQQTDSISQENASAILHVLAADSLKGRGNGSPELLKAGLFIGSKFGEFGLLPLTGTPGYYLPFRPVDGPELTAPDMLNWNDGAIPPAQFMFLRQEPGNYGSKELTDFTVIRLDSCFSNDILYHYRDIPGNILLWTSRLQPDGENFFPELIKIPPGGLKQQVLLVYATAPPDSITLTGLPAHYSKLEYNVVGMLPGRTKPGEVVIISAHYDHEGISRTNARDSIMNGANDDASGVTALLLLADYWAKKKDNERTVFFCAFAGEELGLKGSQPFTRLINLEKIVAVINIEMIGVPQYGKGTVFITGHNESELPRLLEKGLKTAKIRTTREPDEGKSLFQRSDNYPFFRAGIPAHTIMSSDDDEPCYHKPCDEIKRIDITHLTRVTRGIAVAAELIINGMEIPARVKAE